MLLPDLFDVFQQGQIAQAQANASSAKDDASRTGNRLVSETQRLESKIDGLALICQALIEILRDSGGVSESAIEKKIREIDLRDGKADGRIIGKPLECTQCRRPAHTRQKVCMYCGTAIKNGMLVEKPLGER
jgi:hypothetical protein